MKALLILILLILSTPCFAADVSPLSFGVQYMKRSIGGAPMVAFMFTIRASDFPSMGFNQISASIVDSTTGAALTRPQTVYTKQASTTIVGSEVMMFSYQDATIAPAVIGALRSSKVLFNADDGSSFSINLAELCNSKPDSFNNMFGRTGCP